MSVGPRKRPPQSSTADNKKAARTPKEKALQPWEQRPWPKRGDRSARTLFAAVGASLSLWETCDWAFGLVFARLIAPSVRDPTAAMQTYASIRTFEGRLALVRASGRAYFRNDKGTPLAKEFWKVCGEAMAYAGRRNEIAHGLIKPYTPNVHTSEFDTSVRKRRHRLEKTGKHPPVESCLYPSNSLGDKYDYYGLPLYAYSSVEIGYYTGKFFELQREITELCSVLEKNYEERQKLPSGQSTS